MQLRHRLPMKESCIATFSIKHLTINAWLVQLIITALFSMPVRTTYQITLMNKQLRAFILWHKSLWWSHDYTILATLLSPSKLLSLFTDDDSSWPLNTFNIEWGVELVKWTNHYYQHQWLPTRGQVIIKIKIKINWKKLKKQKHESS